MICYVADTETTGVSPKDKLVEIAWFEVDEDLNIVDKFDSLIDPEIPIHPAASAAHHLVASDLTTSPTIEELFSIVLKNRVFEPATLICHNVSFDQRYWPREMNVSSHCCTLRAARKLYPYLESHAMQVLRYEFGLGSRNSTAHRALGDVEILFELLQKMLKDSEMSLPDFVTWSMGAISVKVMPFGKYKGKKLAAIPANYVDWLLSKTDIDLDLKSSLLKL